MTGYEGPDRRTKPKRLSAAQVAERLADHERDCSERYGNILQTLTALQTDLQPVVEVYRGSRFAGKALVGLLKFAALFATVAGAIYAAWAWAKGA